ncbi:MAG: leucine-rich repeat domain-containing protein [Alistipes sp.]|nr:leucine-rich repeat domain-containing protein [Alistipes sp.]
MKTKNIFQIAFAFVFAAAAVSCSSGNKVNEKPDNEEKLVQWHPEAVPSDEIHFQTTTGNPMTPYETTASYFGANFLNASYTGKTGILKFDGEITKVGMQALRDNDGTDGTFVTQLKLPESVKSIGHYAFDNHSFLEQFTISENVETIQQNPFRGCIGLKRFYGKFVHADDPRCLVVNGELKAFAPAGLDSYTLPDDITSVGDSAFAYVELEELTLPESVTQIAMAAFNTCWYLKKLTILGDLTQFGYGAFERNNSLEDIYCKASVPPAFEYNVKPSSSDMPSLKHVYVPRASVDAYKSAWEFAADKIEGYDF